MRGFGIALLLLSQSACVRQQPTPLARAAQYLWDQQSDDGGWHSHTYGLLRSGQSLTPFVLDALLHVPGETYPLPTAKVDRALAFIRRNTQSSGALGLADPGIPDYPNYSTGLAVTALCRAHRQGLEQQVNQMTAYLRAQQFTAQNGWRTSDPVYGAWGMGGDRRTPPDTGHVDLSMTRYVIDALRAAAVPSSDPALREAGIFIERCQNFDPKHPESTDGGFFFSTTEFDTNKAGREGDHFRSYGTTTADGILALLAVGYDRGHPRVVAAQRWLTTHHHEMSVPGFVGEAYHRWPQGLAFYYAAAVSRTFQALNQGAAPGIREALERSQRRDGGWSNPENLVKEDDPLIATAFAIRALALFPDQANR
jgi:hypothetical protein